MRELARGEIFDGKYRLEGILGQGGFAVVYRATELASAQPVALKVLTPEPGRFSDIQLARFDREVRIAQTLHDPHSVRVLAHGRTPDGAPYAVFEFVDGRELAERMRESGPLPPAVVEHILKQLLAALGEAHRKGLVHRDIKPENILVYTNGADEWAVKLLDFGIARPVVRRDARLTATGELVGTPRYMSPEQLTDAPLSAASDIYSLGIVAFELLYGSDMLHGGRWGDQLDRLRQSHKLVAPAEGGLLPVVIGRMTERQLERRFPSAEAVLAALERRHPAEPTVARAPARSWVPVAAAGCLVGAGIALVWVGGEDASLSSEGVSPERARTLIAPPASGEAPRTPEPERQEPDAATDTGAPEPVEPLLGCGAPPPFAGRVGEIAPLHAELKQWWTYIPSSYEPDKRHPVVVLLHDSAQDPEPLIAHGGFGPVADKHGFIVVAPDDGVRDPWQGREDDDRVTAIVAETAAQLCVDTRRVFIAGYGDGGRVVRRLSCDDRITGAAVFAYRDYVGHHDFRCKPTHPQPYLYIAPADSPYEPREGGKTCNHAQTMALDKYDELLRGKNRCSSRQIPSAIALECISWDRCEAPYVRCLVPGGRTWPRAERFTFHPECEGGPTKFALAEHMWKFFATLNPLNAPDVAKGVP